MVKNFTFCKVIAVSLCSGKKQGGNTPFTLHIILTVPPTANSAEQNGQKTFPDAPADFPAQSQKIIDCSMFPGIIKNLS